MKLIHEYTSWIRDLRRNRISAREFIFYNKKGVPMTAITLCLPFIKPENGHPFATVCYFFDLSDMESHISAWSPGMIVSFSFLFLSFSFFPAFFNFFWHEDTSLHSSSSCNLDLQRFFDSQIRFNFLFEWNIRYTFVVCLVVCFYSFFFFIHDIRSFPGQILLNISHSDLLYLGFSKDLVQYFIDKIQEERAKESVGGYAGIPVYSPLTYSIKKMRHRTSQGMRGQRFSFFILFHLAFFLFFFLVCFACVIS
jgi:hypothetical protein